MHIHIYVDYFNALNINRIFAFVPNQNLFVTVTNFDMNNFEVYHLSILLTSKIAKVHYWEIG